MDQGGYYNYQSYGGYEDYMPQQGCYNIPFISPCTTQTPPPNGYHDAQFQDPYTPHSYQDQFYFSQPSYQNFFQQYPQDFNPPQYPYPTQDYSPNSYLSPPQYSSYPQDTQPPYEHQDHSPSVGNYGIDEKVLEPQLNQPFDEETRAMMINLMNQMNLLQVQMDNLVAQRQSLATQEPIKNPFPYEEVLHELFVPSEGGNEKEGEDLEDKDEDDEEVDEEIEMEPLNWEEGVELHENGGKEEVENGGNEQLQNAPVEEEMLKEIEIDRMHEVIEETPSMDENSVGENFSRVWEPGGVNVLESVGPHWPIFISKDSSFVLVHEDDPRFFLLAKNEENEEEEKSGDQEKDQVHGYYLDPRFRKKSLVDLWIKNGFEEGICLKFDLDEHSFLNFEVVKMSLREFIDGHHLKKYLEEKFARKDGMFFLQSNDG